MKNITFLIPSLRGGGAEKAALSLANELVSRGWQVTLLLARIEGPFLEKLDKRINVNKLPYKNISRNIFEIKRYLEKENPSIFFSSMNYVNVVASFSFAISRTKSKLIVCEQNDISQVLKNCSWFLRTLMRQGIKIFYSRASNIVCVSKGVENSLRLLFPHLTSTTVIYNPIEQYTLEPLFLNKKKDHYQILTVGRLASQKNHSFLINAFYELQTLYPKGKLKLTILGEGNLRKELEDQINTLGLTNNVCLPGFQEPKQYFMNSDLFVLTSIMEGFPNVLGEALSAGLPVVSTNCKSGPSEILDNGKYGLLVSVNDKGQLVTAMRELLENPNKSSSVTERKNRAKEFSIQQIADQYEKLFLG